MTLNDNDADFGGLTLEERRLIQKLREYSIFDSAYYLERYKDVHGDPMIHFVRYGINERHQPSIYFDPVWYSKYYGLDAGLNPTKHYLEYGKSEQRKGYNTEVIWLLAVEHCTNSCKYCSTNSPFSKPKTHSAEEFFPWLDQLEANKIPFKYIGITGGEPFLHPNLTNLIQKLKQRYPSKSIKVITNFFWANEETINRYAPIIRELDTLEISKYPNIVDRMKGKFNSFVDLLKQHCSNTKIEVWDRQIFYAWDMHIEKKVVLDRCGTSDCCIVRADGKVSHCAIGVNLDKRQEYKPFLELSEELFFDLRTGTKGFLEWSKKYPFDLCYHCSNWEGVSVPWSEVK